MRLLNLKTYSQHTCCIIGKRFVTFFYTFYHKLISGIFSPVFCSCPERVSYGLAVRKTCITIENVNRNNLMCVKSWHPFRLEDSIHLNSFGCETILLCSTSTCDYVSLGFINRLFGVGLV